MDYGNRLDPLGPTLKDLTSQSVATSGSVPDPDPTRAHPSRPLLADVTRMSVSCPRQVGGGSGGLNWLPGLGQRDTVLRGLAAGAGAFLIGYRKLG